MRIAPTVLSALLLTGSATAQLLVNINSVSFGPADGGSYPEDLVNLGSRAVFAADDGVTGKELWVSDGTVAGTFQLTDYNGSGDSMVTTFGQDIRRLNGRAIFTLDDGLTGGELWVTDGTISGTTILKDLAVGPASSRPSPLALWQGELYFRASDSGNGLFQDLYATDGTPQGTRLVKDFVGLDTIDGATAIEHQGHLYFAARTNGFGRELWKTDGTTSGTSMVADAVPGVMSGIEDLRGASFGSYLYYRGKDSAGMRDVWRTDGTAAGTVPFSTVSAFVGNQPTDFQVIGSRLVFQSRVNFDWQYHSTDGVTVTQLSQSPLYVHGWELQSNGDLLIGMLRGPNGSFELWATDGTTAGSGIIQQIQPDGSAYVNFEAWRVTSGNKLLFRAGNSAVGSELFVTDGTAAGTSVLADLAAGPSDADVYDLVRVGDSLLFGAQEAATGFELYRLPWTDVIDWLAEPFGEACASNGSLPRIGASGSAQPGATLTVEVRDASPLAPAFHYWSPGYAFVELGACSLYLASPQFAGTSPTNAQGEANFPIPVPNSPALIGLGFWMQSLALDLGGGFLGLGGLTPALEVRIGG